MGRRAVFAASALSGLIALVGCAAGAAGPSPTDPHELTTTTTLATTTTTLSMEDGLTEYRGCLTEHGVPIAVIPVDGLGHPRMAEALAGLDLSDRDVLDALDACGHFLSSGALDLGSDAQLRHLVQQELEDLADCIRGRGVAAYPDPVNDFDGVGSPFPVDRIPWTDPDLPDAVAACTSSLDLSRGS